MANTKKCNKCNEVKTLDDFHNNRNSKDNKQPSCKVCMIKRSKQQRIDNPDYCKNYNTQYHKSNKNGIIYRIINPLGETYIGSTKKLINIRFGAHRASYKHSNGVYPILHNSFDTWGIDAHIFEEVCDLGKISKKELEYVESQMIKNLMNNGKSLNGKL